MHNDMNERARWRNSVCYLINATAGIVRFHVHGDRGCVYRVPADVWQDGRLDGHVTY